MQMAVAKMDEVKSIFRWFIIHSFKYAQPLFEYHNHHSHRQLQEKEKKRFFSPLRPLKSRIDENLPNNE